MLMRALLPLTAHETSGAARIRHSLRPLDFEGEEILANLGQIVPRDRETISTSSLRTQGTHNPGRSLLNTLEQQPLPLSTLVVMGPCVRRDDSRVRGRNAPRAVDSCLLCFDIESGSAQIGRGLGPQD